MKTELTAEQVIDLVNKTRQDTLKEVFDEFEKIIPCRTCLSEHSCSCIKPFGIHHESDCDIKEYCLNIKELKKKCQERLTSVQSIEPKLETK